MKVAKIGYGRDGRGVGNTEDGYAYLVSDTVRTGDVLQPISTNWKSGKKFVTTGKVNHSYKDTSVIGIEEKQKAISANDGKNLTRAYTGKELGVKDVGISPTTTPQYKMPYSKGQIGQYQQLNRGLQVEKYQQENPQAQFTQKAQTYEELYIKPYMEAQKK